MTLSLSDLKSEIGNKNQKIAKSKNCKIKKLQNQKIAKAEITTGNILIRQLHPTSSWEDKNFFSSVLGKVLAVHNKRNQLKIKGIKVYSSK